MIVAAFTILIFFVGSTVLEKFKNSEPYKISLKSISSNQEILEKVGKIEGFDFFVQGSLKSNYAFFLIGVNGTKDDIDVRCELIKDMDSGVWKLVEMEW